MVCRHVRFHGKKRPPCATYDTCPYRVLPLAVTLRPVIDVLFCSCTIKKFSSNGLCTAVASTWYSVISPTSLLLAVALYCDVADPTTSPCDMTTHHPPFTAIRLNAFPLIFECCCTWYQVYVNLLFIPISYQGSSTYPPTSLSALTYLPGMSSLALSGLHDDHLPHERLSRTTQLHTKAKGKRRMLAICLQLTSTTEGQAGRNTRVGVMLY